ncbi:hypothetical protein F2P81_002317 [Scophthalmus maximus]|uniref:Protein Shroom2 n=1 Tax=Scophthalmus maximus TaxID=52904 RepID=A0A6A4TN45_SCOMX|nr:hypothetical protein F2P81_002317 [Scophthalmus maximus]
MRWRRDVGKWRGTARRRKQEEDEELVEVLLRGKAPWGFTLRGGTEHREPLIITKVEKGSAAAAVHLLAGDEMVRVNAVPLSGSRQEAICLVKSSHKTLTLVVRRAQCGVGRPPPPKAAAVAAGSLCSSANKLVNQQDVSPLSYLGAGKNDPGSRPHSWHSSKLTEEESEPAGRDVTPAPVWQPKHEASDSFAATKVFPYDEGPSGPTKTHGRSIEKLIENNNQNGLRSHQEKSSEARPGFNPLHAKDFLHPSTAADHNHNQLRPKKLFSLSSNDVRQSHYTQVPAHQRQYSDESPFYLQTRSAPTTKTQSVGSYYRSLQDLPANIFSRKQVRHSTATMPANPNLECWGHSRYYGPASKHLFQTAEHQARQGKAEGRRGEKEKHHWVNSNEPGFPGSLKGNVKARYSLPQSQMPYSENNGHSHLGNGLHYDHQTSEHSNRSRSPEDATRRGEGNDIDMKRQFPTHPSNDQMVSLSRQHDLWVPQEDHRISPLKTPLLHSLAKESRSLAEQPAAMTLGVMPTQDTGDNMATSSGKMNRRSDRYATTLRKEIQQKRAQLQKSRSAATLTCDAEDEEVEEWRSTETSTPSGVSFSNTYKDHLKEAQARVLQATSFQRRDLEPLGPEVQVVKTSNGRIRGRKRFPLAKRTHSFSEPDKIDKVGVEVGPQTGSFGARRRFFEAKPAFSRPVLRSSHGTNLNIDLDEIRKLKENTPTGEPGEPHSSTDPDLLSPGHRQTLLEQQRLGTFAEYQATWNKQKKLPEAKTQGRYHSAENILDADAEEKVICTHERSRSSPSADFYTQNIPSSWRDPQAQQSSYTTGEKAENRLQYQPDHSPQSAPSVPRKEGPALGLSDHRSKPNAANPSQTTLSSGPRSLSPNPGSQHPAQPAQTKGLLPPPRPHLGPETTSSSQEFQAGSQANPATLQPLSSCSSDTQHHATTQGSSAGPATASSPHLSWTSVPDMSEGDVQTEQEKEQLAPPSSPFSSWTAALPLPTADRARSPSPQFAPLRLTDKPPTASLQDDSTLRSENELKPTEVMDANSPARRVPVRIIHAESSSDREGRAYLPQTSDPCGSFEPSPHIPCLGATEHQASSLFSAYTRQVAWDQGQESVPELSSAGAQRSEEDAKRDELARDIMGKDKSLVDILDQSGRKTTMDLMEGLFPPEEQILEGVHQRRMASTGSRLPTSSPRSTDSSSYYNTSAPKAELLIKMKDMQGQMEEQDSEDELDIDLASKKQELISSLARKLEVLREARQSLQEDVEDNETLGREVEATVQRLCQPNQLDKFRMFVGDLDKVVSLLLSLSGRLARVENALNTLEEDASPEEKRTLTEKRKLLMRQHEDAKELKENLDRRERLVSGIMGAHLDAASLDDYRHFVKMKSALIIEQRKLEDKIKLGEEQLKGLLDSLPLEQRSLL